MKIRKLRTNLRIPHNPHFVSKNEAVLRSYVQIKMDLLSAFFLCPLTLTLSLGEREQQTGFSLFSDIQSAKTDVRSFTRLRTIRPPHEPERGALLRQSVHHRYAEQCSALHSGVQCADLSGNSLPKGEGRGENSPNAISRSEPLNLAAPPLPAFGHPLLHSEWRRGTGRGGAQVHGEWEGATLILPSAATNAEEESRLSTSRAP